MLLQGTNGQDKSGKLILTNHFGKEHSINSEIYIIQLNEYRMLIAFKPIEMMYSGIRGKGKKILPWLR